MPEETQQPGRPRPMTLGPSACKVPVKLLVDRKTLIDGLRRLKQLDMDKIAAQYRKLADDAHR